MPMDTVRPLRRDTWDVYAQLIERHNGGWGGCCLAFHPPSPERGHSVQGNRALKQRLVDAGRANAAVVFDGDRAIELPLDATVVADCRGPYGVMSNDALALLKTHGRRGVRLAEGLPDWRAAGHAVDVVRDRA